jgi:hypothetical protein
MNQGQIANVHIAKSQLQLDDGEYRLILRNVAGVTSSKDLDNSKLEKVMAFFEERGFRQKDQPQDYWRRKYHAQGQFCGERMTHLINQLSQQVKYPLDSLVARASKGRTARLEELNPAEANNLVEMLKSMAARHEGTEPRRQEGGHSCPPATPRRRGQLVQQNLFGMPDAPPLSPRPAAAPPASRAEKDAAIAAAVTDEEVPF